MVTFDDSSTSEEKTYSPINPSIHFEYVLRIVHKIYCAKQNFSKKKNIKK